MFAYEIKKKIKDIEAERATSDLEVILAHAIQRLKMAKRFSKYDQRSAQKCMEDVQKLLERATAVAE